MKRGTAVLKNSNQPSIEPVASPTSTGSVWLSTWRWDLIALGLPALAMAYALFSQVQFLWDRPHLQFFPLAIAALAWLVYTELVDPHASGQEPDAGDWDSDSEAAADVGSSDAETSEEAGAGPTLADEPSQSNAAVRRPVSAGRLRWSLALLTIVCLQLVFGAFIGSTWWSHVALTTAFVAWALVRLTETTWTRVVALASLLAVTIPLPFTLDTKLIQWLQIYSSWACSGVLDAFAIPHLRSGNIIRIQGRELFIEEACSGVDSLYALFAVALVLILFWRRPFLPAVLLLISVPIWSSLGNLLRLTTIALGIQKLGIDLSDGMPHTILGLVIFMLIAGCLLAADALLYGLLSPIAVFGIPRSQVPKSIALFNAIAGWPGRQPQETLAEQRGAAELMYGEDEEEEPAAEGETTGAELSQAEPVAAAVRTASFGTPALITVCVLLVGMFLAGGLQAYQMSRRVGRLTANAIRPELVEQFPGEGFLPEQIGPWRQETYLTETRDRNSSLGEYSRTWYYASPDGRLVFSLDFPFREWHQLWACYEGVGWRRADTQIVDTAPDGSTDPWPWVEVEMVNELGARSYLWWSMFDQAGGPMQPEDHTSWLWKRHVLDRIALKNPYAALTSFQFQQFADTSRALSDEERAALRQQFLEVRQAVHAGSLPALQNLGGRGQ
jgi:exosortase